MHQNIIVPGVLMLTTFPYVTYPREISVQMLSLYPCIGDQNLIFINSCIFDTSVVSKFVWGV